jgi:hypothetical protein
MDIRLLLRLISRFWYIAIVGLALAVAATIFSAARLDSSNWQLSYRQKLQYTSTAVILVDGNQPSWLYAVPPGDSTASSSSAASSSLADPARLGGLTALYGYFVRSDAVRKLTGDDPINSVSAETITTAVGNNTDPLPLLAIIGTGGSPKAAQNLAQRVTTAFRNYVLHRQTVANVSRKEGVSLQMVNAPRPGTLVAPRSFTRSIVAGLLTLIATIGLMLLLENLRPSKGTSDDDVVPEPSDSPDATRARRYANRTSTGRASIATIGTATAQANAQANAQAAEPIRRVAPPQ